MTVQNLNDEEISMMCDIAQTAGTRLNARKRDELQALIAEGLVAVVEEARAGFAAEYRLTDKGQKMLDDRGIGITES
ncbi:MAG TPA: hypothetical protein VNQ99_06745 [Xanthobacteraceae bacterium]|nr:hypothetical protein [Xanthobacteraceae bacterium]